MKKFLSTIILTSCLYSSVRALSFKDINYRNSITSSAETFLHGAVMVGSMKYFSKRLIDAQAHFCLKNSKELRKLIKQGDRKALIEAFDRATVRYIFSIPSLMANFVPFVSSFLSLRLREHFSGRALSWGERILTSIVATVASWRGIPLILMNIMSMLNTTTLTMYIMENESHKKTFKDLCKAYRSASSQADKLEAFKGMQRFVSDAFYNLEAFGKSENYRRKWKASSFIGKISFLYT